ncbi:MAG: hypothetical protein AAF456_08925 [Planctomycetota bacterium]
MSHDGVAGDGVAGPGSSLALPTLITFSTASGSARSLSGYFSLANPAFRTVMRIAQAYPLNWFRE